MNELNVLHPHVHTYVDIPVIKNVFDNTVVAVGFDSDIYNVVENEERVVVCLRLFEGVIERDFSVSATVINGNATSKLT